MYASTVTVFIVNYKSTKEINRNLKLIYEQNKFSTKIRCLIIDNSLDFVLENEKLRANVTVLPHRNNEAPDRYGKGSIDHARSLNLYVNNSSYHTDFTIVMDPDCYIYGNNWITLSKEFITSLLSTLSCLELSYTTSTLVELISKGQTHKEKSLSKQEWVVCVWLMKLSKEKLQVRT